MADPFEIFRPGKHTASSGQSLEFSEDDLKASAAAYNPALHEAPIVVGHPKQDAPAYGWVKALSFSEAVLLADPDRVDAAFAEMVGKGYFKKVSASFYLPDSPQNPVPGVYYLRHVGFLGAAAPAVKGLKPVSFSETEKGVIEFGCREDGIVAGMFRGLREWIIPKFGMEEADKALPGWNVTDLETSAAMPEEIGMEAMPSYSEPAAAPTKQEDEVGLTPAEIAAREAAFAEREAKILKREAAARHTEHLSFAEGLVKEGKLVAAQLKHAVAILDFAAGVEGETVDFGEKKESLCDSLKIFLAGQAKVIEFAEIATRETDPGKGGAAEKLDALTKAKMEKKSISYSEAFAEVQTEHPALTAEYEMSFR